VAGDAAVLLRVLPELGQAGARAALAAHGGGLKATLAALLAPAKL
jgi:hypothetical protein